MTALAACAGIGVLVLGLGLASRSDIAARVRLTSKLAKLLTVVAVALLLYGAVAYR